MLGFALISEWPFDWAFFSGVYWGHQNVYFTLLLGLLAMKALDTYQTAEGMPALKGILGAAACFLAAALLHCDYDVLGLALILALYMTRKDKRAQCIAGAVFSLFERWHRWRSGWSGSTAASGAAAPNSSSGRSTGSTPPTFSSSVF